jgi:hypothetical protein
MLATHKTQIEYAAFDISADLTELSHTPILLVSAGVKSILDVGRTLEFLVCLFYSHRKEDDTDLTAIRKPKVSMS